MKIFKIFLIAIFLIVLSGGLFIGYLGWSFLHAPASAKNQEIIFELKPQMSFQKASLELETKGLIQSAHMFNLLAKFSGKRSHIKVGEYALNTNMSPLEILRIFESGKSIAYDLTIPEGYNIFEIAEIIENAKLSSAQEFLTYVNNPLVVKKLLGEEHASLEGYLFPETYNYTKFSEMKTVVNEMVRKFLSVADALQVKSNSQLTRHQLITLASIVEKETGAPEERPLIASVFYNRLQKKMRLQTDPTIIYSLALKNGKIPTNISKKDLSFEHPYNTYVIAGLPPGPIANPGRQALQAVLQPAQSEYLYFVSQNNGTHIFSKDYTGHLKAVQKFQMNPKAREGKSWRDLKSKNQNSKRE